MRWRAFIAAVAMLAAGTVSAKDLRWAVYYSSEAPIEAFEPYQLLVLDAEYHPPLEPLRARKKVLYGYLSIGEVAQHQRHYDAVKAAGLLVRENPVWKGSWAVDVRDPRWTARILEELIPSILHKGFDGLFLDTVDSAVALETSDRAANAGMTEAVIRLVKTIRRHYPQIRVIMNRGYEVLPEVAGDIDAIVGEAVYARYDFKTKTYVRVPEAEYRAQVDLLQGARKRNPDLRVFSLDYWRSDDPAGIRKIYDLQRANGFEPYVATVKLDSIIPEPGS